MYYTIKNNYDFINNEINSKDELIKNAENVLDTLETYNHILIIIGAVVAATIFAFIVYITLVIQDEVRICLWFGFVVFEAFDFSVFTYKDRRLLLI